MKYNDICEGHFDCVLVLTPYKQLAAKFNALKLLCFIDSTEEPHWLLKPPCS